MSAAPVFYINPESEPTERGFGKAWRVDLDVLAEPKLATVSSFFVYAPWAHPFWPGHVLTMCHLRDEPGLPPAKKRSDDATHELMIFALNPEKPFGTLSLLNPVSVVTQGKFESDDKAAAWLHDRVREIMLGDLSPDSDYRRAWEMKMRDPDVRLEFRPTITLHQPGQEPVEITIPVEKPDQTKN